MLDYQNGQVYTIRCKSDNTLIYVGSTTQPLAKRWGGHKVDSLNERCQNRLIYKTINNNWDDWYIELYEEYPCENKQQLNRREGEIIREIGTLNSKISGITLQESIKLSYEKHREKIKERKKIYREEHKEEISAKRIAYYNEVQSKNKEYINIKQRENYAKRQAKKKDIEPLNPV